MVAVIIIYLAAAVLSARLCRYSLPPIDGTCYTSSAFSAQQNKMVTQLPKQTHPNPLFIYQNCISLIVWLRQTCPLQLNIIFLRTVHIISRLVLQLRQLK